MSPACGKCEGETESTSYRSKHGWDRLPHRSVLSRESRLGAHDDNTQPPRMVNTSCGEEGREIVSSGRAVGTLASLRARSRKEKYRGYLRGLWTGFTHVLLLPVLGLVGSNQG